MKNALLLLPAILLAVGCTGSGGGGGGGGGQPQTQQEALQKLSEAHRAFFEKWKASVTKSCDASEAFGMSHQGGVEATGIDASALISENNMSLVFTDGDSLAVLTDTDSFPGVANTKHEETTTLNGQSTYISAETKRGGSHCEVYLYGVKVYESNIYASFTIGAHLNPGKVAALTGTIPQVRTVGPSGAYEVAQSSVFPLISSTLKPTEGASDIIANKLGLTHEQGAQYFRLGNGALTNAAIRLGGDTKAIWTNAQDGTLMSENPAVRNLFDGSPHKFAVEVRFGAPLYSVKNDTPENKNDLANVSTFLQIAVEKKDAGMIYAVTSAASQVLIPFDSSEALLCLKSRAHAFLQSGNSPADLQPSVDKMTGPCKTLKNDILSETYKTGHILELAKNVLAGVRPSPQVRYNGWDGVVSKIAVGFIDAGKDLQQALDPDGISPVLQLVAKNLETLSEKEKNYTQLSKVHDALNDMSLNWSFVGFSVDGARIEQILQAMNNTSDVFPISSTSLINSLAQAPNAFAAELQFAASIDADYKAEAMKAQTLAKDLNYNSFEQEVFGRVIQDRISIDVLRNWTQNLSSVQADLAKYPQLAPVKSEATGLAVGLLKKGQATREQITATLAALSNVMDPFDGSTRDLIRDLKDSFEANAPALEFARNVTADYKRVAIAIRDNARAAGYDVWANTFFGNILQTRPSMDQLNVWNDMWTAALGFYQREKNRLASEFGATDWNLKKVMDLAVKETWGPAEFAGLEAIAHLAKLKSSCDHYPDASSQASCAGMSLFSKAPKKFFDPAFANRYTGLANDFIGYMSRLNGFGQESMRFNLMNAFFSSWDPIWSKCDNGAFNAKAGTLRTVLPAYVSNQDPMKEFEYERQIRATLENCN